MLARRLHDEPRGGGRGRVAPRIHRWPYVRAPVAARTEDDAGPMACGRKRGRLVGQQSAGAPGCDSGAATVSKVLSMPLGSPLPVPEACGSSCDVTPAAGALPPAETSLGTGDE